MQRMMLMLKNKLLFKALLIIVMLFMLIPYCNALLAPYVKLFLLWGWVYLFYDFIKEKRILRCRSLWILLLFCVCYGITILWNNGEFFTANVKALAYMIMVFLIFYGDYHGRSKDQITQEIHIISRIVAVVTSFFALVCLWMFFTNVEGVCYIDGVYHVIGVAQQRLWGLYNANTGGALNATSILITVGLLSVGQRKGWKYFYWFNLLIQTICLILTYSRTSIYALLLGGAAGIFCYWYRGKKKFYYGLLAAIAFLVIGYSGVEVSRSGLLDLYDILKDAKTQGIVENEISSELEQAAIPESDPETETVISEEEAFRLAVAARDGGVLTGRPILWKGGIRAFLKDPIWGVTREGLYDSVAPELEDPVWSPDLQKGGLHNGYLTVLVCSGLLGSICLLIFFLYTLRKMVPSVWHWKRRERGWYAGVLLFCVYLIMETMEARVMYQMNFFFVIFWLCYGYIVHLEETINEQKVDG